MNLSHLANMSEPIAPEPAGKVEVGPEGGEFTDIRTEAPLTDWGHIFEKFQLDPAEFVIIDDTVRMSMWQQSKRTESGDRDVVNLYSYRARFRRRTQYTDQATLEDMVDRLRAVPKPAPSSGAQPVTLFVGLADWQLGKSYGPGRGTDETIARINQSRAAIHQYLEQRRQLGYSIEKIILANMGDPVENVQGSYANQPHMVDLNMRDQLTLAIDTSLEWIRDLAPYAPIEYAATLCNHGQLTRGTGKTNVTDDADNASGFIADTLRTVTSHIPNLASMTWAIPRDNMITRVTASGVRMPLAHGHKITGPEERWLSNQTNALSHEGWRPDLWVTAHRHHANVTDFGPYHRIQCTTVDPGSKHFSDETGQYATPGTTVFLAGAHLPHRFAEYAVL